MVQSLENIDKSKVSATRIEGLEGVVEDTISNTLTGAVSTITTSDLTAGKVLVSDANGKVATGSDALSDLVHKSGDETIGGSKTFTGTQKLNGNTLKCFSFAKGTNPSSTQYANIYLTDNTGTNGDNTTLGRFRTQVNSEGLVSTYMTSFKNTTGNSNSSIGIHYPASGDPYTNAPTPATSDNSTKIATTAFVKAQGYAVDSDVVHKTGNETINGTKTFTSDVYVSRETPRFCAKNTALTKGTAPSANVYSGFNFYDSSNNAMGRVLYGYSMTKTSSVSLDAFKANSSSDTAVASIAIHYPASGNPYTSAPTPATNDDSTKIATTAWVKNQGYITSATDTKNTAGSTDTSSKIFLIGATSQAANPQTYSHDTVYVNTSGQLVSSTPGNSTNSTVVATTAFVKSVLSTSGQGLFTISKAANGYCKFNGGLIVQWGTSTGSGSQAITFPTSFTSTNYRVTGNSYGTSYCVVDNNSKTKTGVTVGNDTGFDWIAVGY